jgi:hypothetical protein
MNYPAVILHSAYAATLSGGSWALPLTNAQDPDIGIVARSTDPLNASTKFTADLGSARQVGGLVLGPVNLSPASTYRFRGYSDVALTTLVYDSTVKAVSGSTVDWSSTANWLAWENPDFWLGIPDADSFAGLPLYLAEIPDVDKTARYWLVEMFDAANGDGAVRFGRFMICKAYRPAFTFDEGNNALTPDFVGDVQETMGGLFNYWDRATRRSWRATFSSISESEMFGPVFDMVFSSRLSRQVFVVPAPLDTANFRKRSFLATFKQAPALVQLTAQRGSTAYDFLEVS